jgi:hypothetical protein
MKVASLWISSEALPEKAAEHLDAIARWLLEASDRLDVCHEWIEGNDSTLRLAASRVIAKTTQDLEGCRGFSPSSRLASAALEVLRGLADKGDVEQLATASARGNHR